MKTVLITGGTGKVGQALVRHFESAGWRVGFTSRSSSRAAALRGSRIEAFVCDLSRPRAARKLGDALAKRKFFPDALVHAARDRDNLKVPGSGVTPREAFVKEFTLGVVAPYELTLDLAARRGSRLSSVVHVASVYGVVAPNPGLYDNPAVDSPVQYGVAKAALIHLTKELAVRLAPRVRVNAVSYGGVKGRASRGFEKRYAKLAPAARMLEDDDLGGAAEFLAGPQSKGMTGHNLVVDGGLTAW